LIALARIRLEISNSSPATQTYAAKINDSNRTLYKCSWWWQPLANQLLNFLVLLAMYREFLVLLSNEVIKLPAHYSSLQKSG
jgi:hypothetical protein